MYIRPPTPLRSQGVPNCRPLIRSRACLLDVDAEARRSAADVYGEDRLRCCEAQARQRWNLDIHLQDTGHQGGRRTCVEYCRGDFQYLAASQVLNLRPSLGKLDWKRPPLRERRRLRAGWSGRRRWRTPGGPIPAKRVHRCWESRSDSGQRTGPGMSASLAGYWYSSDELIVIGLREARKGEKE